LGISHIRGFANGFYTRQDNSKGIGMHTYFSGALFGLGIVLLVASVSLGLTRLKDLSSKDVRTGFLLAVAGYIAGLASLLINLGAGGVSALTMWLTVILLLCSAVAQIGYIMVRNFALFSTERKGPSEPRPAG
jgi:hypothetical protein